MAVTVRSHVVCFIAMACAAPLAAQGEPVNGANEPVARSDFAPEEAAIAPLAACPAPPVPQFWARGEYVAFLFGTGKLVEIGKEMYNSELFNSLLAAAGKNFKDVGQTLLGDQRNGVRFTVGAWLDDNQSVGFEASLLYLNRGSLVLPIGNRDHSPLANIVPNSDLIIDQQRNFDSSFDRVDHAVLVALLSRRLGVPGIDAAGRQVVVPIGNRDLVDANVQLDIAAKTFCMFDLLGRARLMECDCCRVDGLLGYRRISSTDSLRVQTEVETLAPPLLPGTQISSFEQIRSFNYYDGVLLGVDLSYDCCPWTLTARPTATIAQLNAIVRREAATVVTFPDGRFGVLPGGAVLSGSTLSDLATTSCTVIPELALSAARQCGEHFRLYFGTSILYLPQAAYSSAQFQLGIDPNRALAGGTGIPQPPTPTSPELHSGLAITMSIGLELSY
jgi:hypothetical protein